MLRGVRCRRSRRGRTVVVVEPSERSLEKMRKFVKGFAEKVEAKLRRWIRNHHDRHSPGPWASRPTSFPALCLPGDRKSTRLNSSHSQISYAVFCLKKKKQYSGDLVLR